MIRLSLGTRKEQARADCNYTHTGLINKRSLLITLPPPMNAKSILDFGSYAVVCVFVVGALCRAAAGKGAGGGIE